MPAKKHLRPDLTPAGQLLETSLHQLVGYQLAQAAIVTSAIFESEAGVALDLRRVEFTILMLLRENPASSSARLARALSVTAPNITMWIDRLLLRGLVSRETNANDRRANHLRLTPAGEQLAADALQRLLAGEAAALAPLSVGERAILVELLHKVAQCRTA